MYMNNPQSRPCLIQSGSRMGLEFDWSTMIQNKKKRPRQYGNPGTLLLPIISLFSQNFDLERMLPGKGIVPFTGDFPGDFYVLFL